VGVDSARLDGEEDQELAGPNGTDANVVDVLTLDDLIEVAREVYWADEADGWVEGFDEFADHNIQHLWDERKSVVGFIAALKMVKAAIDTVLAKRLGPVGKVRLDDYLVTAGADRKLRVTDAEGFVEWIGEDWPHTFSLTSAQVRVQSLREIAKRRGLDPDHAIDTFCEWRLGPSRVSTIPLSRAGKYAAEMEQGETRGVPEGGG
jgi:hypothetical protein